MSYETHCPSCGAELVFALGSSLLKVCDHCGVAVARKGADLGVYGKVAELVSTSSILKLGVTGDYAGAPPFTLVGRLQLDYGAGTWDEWLMAFRGETWAWLSESQGKFHYLGQMPLPPAPDFGRLHVGQTVDLGPPGVFVVAEVREARFVSAEGELPFDVAPGSLMRYADLSGPGDQFATLDYGSGDHAEALYVGREVSVEELGFKGLPKEDERRKQAKGQSLSCPQCGGPIEVRAPDQTQRVACPYCGSLLDATKDFAVLEALARVSLKPQIPLGSKGRLDGVEWSVIGCMERSVTVEGVRYPWREYLLYEPKHGFRWLVEAKQHWSFVAPIGTGDVRTRSGTASYRGVPFKHFQGGEAKVDEVLGEFYWAVARGDATKTADYVSPPQMLSMEKTESEVSWSLGTYKTPDEIWKAFGLPGAPPRPQGVAPQQPSPWGAEAWSVYGRAFLFLALITVLFVAFLFAGGHVVHKQSVAFARGARSGAPEAALFTDPIFVASPGNLQVHVTAPVSNSWLYLEGALVNEETGEVDEFDLEVSYYSGSDSDGSWSEGGTRATTYIASVPPGRYVMRLAPQWDPGHPPSGYDLVVKSRVPRFYQFFLAGLALSLWPLGVAWRQFRFEMQRWADSDHPWVEES